MNLNYIPRRPRRLMSGIDDPVRRGAPFSLGVEFTDWAFDTSWRDLPDVMQAIASDIQNSGATQGLVRVYQLAGVLNPFVVVEGQAGHDYSHGYDLRDGLLAVVASQYSGIDYGSVRFEVTTYSPTTGESQQSRVDTPLGSGPPLPPGASLFDQIATDLKIQKSEAQLLVFGGAALLLVLVMKR